MKKRNLVALILTLAMSVSILGACNSSTPAPPASETKPAETTENASDTKPEDVPVNQDVSYRDTVTVGFATEPDKFNPYGGIGPAKDVSAYATYSMLLYIDINTLELVGDLATSWEDANSDGTVWEVKLKEGVQFHNGMTMTAEDVKFTWEYAGSGGTGGSDIVQPIAAYRLVDDIEVVDDATVRFNLNTPVYDFPTYLETYILSKEAYETLPREEADLIGTGPYYLNTEKRQPGVSWTITQFENYHGDLSEHPTKNIVFRVLPDINTRIAALQAGEVDLLTDIDASFWSMLENDPTIELQSRPSGMVYYLGFNFHNVFDELEDLELRKAMAYAVSKDAIIQVAFNGDIGAVASNNFCPPSGLGYVAGLEDPYEYNPEAAKEILAGLGYTPENPLELQVATYAPQIAETMQATFAEVGIKLNIKVVDMNNWSSFKREGQDYDIFIDYVGYRGALMYNFERFFAEGGSAGALCGYTSINYQPLHEKTMNAGSYDNMLTEFAGLQSWVLEDLPLYPMLIKNMISAETATLEGFSPSISNDRTNISKIRVPE